MTEDRAPCRDYERGDCSRGLSCKYFHAEGAAPAADAKVGVCKDYQKNRCDRTKCKFLHLTSEEEAAYNSTGTLPEHGGRPTKSLTTPSSGGKDACKDFMNGRCDRGDRCKYAHVGEFLGNNTLPASMLGDMYGKRPRQDFYSGNHGNGMVVLQENEVMRSKITELQKEVQSLRQMNDTLYEQNAKYRSQLTNTSSAGLHQASLFPATPITSSFNAYSY